jgi:hypothetical protein
MRMAAEKKEYFLCPFSDSTKPRMCPAKHMNAGWKCPAETDGECALYKIVELLRIQKVGY